MANKKGSLFFDDLDIFIIKNISEAYKGGVSVDTWPMSREYVASLCNKSPDKIYSTDKIKVDNAYRNIKKKINRYIEFGFLKSYKDSNGEKILGMDLDRIAVGKHRFSDGYKDCIILRTCPISVK
jgi:hypothetical protein